MGGTTLHAGIPAQWFEMLLLLPFKIYATMGVDGILFDVRSSSNFLPLLLTALWSIDYMICLKKL